MMTIGLVGLGNFGKRHLEAWCRLGYGDRLWIAEPNQTKWVEATRRGIPGSRVADSLAVIAEHVDAVDIVTPTDQHATLCQEALELGKDVLVEKPMTMTSSQARALAELAQARGRVLQVGYYYRCHPISLRLKEALRSGRFGRVRYLTGNFYGFKRARTDVGVTYTDGIHFLDVFNWLLDSPPVDVYAVCRDHFKRGLEDFSVVLLTYPDGVVAKVESGYIQPGRWPDPVVPEAMTTKEITLVGEQAVAQIDFEAQTFTISDAHHEPRAGTWAPVLGQPDSIPVDLCDPVELVSRELAAFVESVKTRAPSVAGPVECGVNLAVLMEAIYDSAHRRERVPVDLGTLMKVS